MSSGPACHCAERKKPVSERLWECWEYKSNHSAFNGYHFTSSNWSSVHCAVCGALWRTTASWALEVHQGVDACKGLPRSSIMSGHTRIIVCKALEPGVPNKNNDVYQGPDVAAAVEAYRNA